MVWLHVQMGNERLEKYPPDVLTEMTEGMEIGTIDSEICVDELVELYVKVIFSKCHLKGSTLLMVY